MYEQKNVQKWAYCCINNSKIKDVYAHGLFNPIFCLKDNLIPKIHIPESGVVRKIIAIPISNLSLGKIKDFVEVKGSIHVQKGVTKKVYHSLDIYNIINKLSKLHKQPSAWGYHNPSEVWRELKLLQSPHSLLEYNLVPETIKKFATDNMKDSANVAIFEAIKKIESVYFKFMETDVIRGCKILEF